MMENNTNTNRAEELRIALVGTPLDDIRLERLTSAALPILGLVNTLFEIDVEGIEPIILPMRKGDCA